MRTVEKNPLTKNLNPAFLFALLTLGACSYTPLQPQATVEDRQPRDAEYGRVESNEDHQPAVADENTEQGEQRSRVAIATPATVSSQEAIDRRRDKRSATDELRAEARTASKQGDFDRAERLLNRALRIAPREPRSYYELAELKLKQQQPGNALQMARKGLSLQPTGRLATKLKNAEQRAIDSML